VEALLLVDIIFKHLETFLLLIVLPVVDPDIGPHMAPGRQHPMHPQMFPEAMDDGIALTPGGRAKMLADVGIGQTPEPSQMLKHAVVNLINYQVKFV